MGQGDTIGIEHPIAIGHRFDRPGLGKTTREHRRTGFVNGFWAACLTAIGVYVVDMFEPLSGRDAVHIILTVAIAVALLTFARLERRAHRDA